MATDGRLNGARAFQNFSPQQSWLRLSQDSGLVLSMASTNLDFAVDASNLSPGDYTAQVNLVHSHGEETITINLTVTPCMDILLPSYLSFGEVKVGETASKDLIIQNRCQEAVTISDSTLPESFGLVEALPITIAAESTETLSVTFSPSSSGIVRSTILLDTDARPESMKSFSVFAAGVLGPQLSLSESSFDESLASGSQIQKTLTITNNGDQELNWSLLPNSVTPIDGNTNLTGPWPTNIFGHLWLDSENQDGPEFSWSSISETGTRLETVSECDDCEEGGSTR